MVGVTLQNCLSNWRWFSWLGAFVSSCVREGSSLGEGRSGTNQGEGREYSQPEFEGFPSRTSPHKDGEVDRLTAEVSHLHQSRQLMELVEHKDLMLSENSASIKNYLDKIVSLAETSSQKDAHIREIEAKLSRCKEKELIQQHNMWLKDELKSKHESLIEMRKAHADLEGDFSSKLVDLENQHCRPFIQPHTMVGITSVGGY